MLDNALELDESNQLAIIQRLFDEGSVEEWVAVRGYDVGASSATYLHAAISSGLTSVTRFFLKTESCDEYLRSLDDDGMSPLQLAEQKLAQQYEVLLPKGNRRRVGWLGRRAQEALNLELTAMNLEEAGASEESGSKDSEASEEKEEAGGSSDGDDDGDDHSGSVTLSESSGSDGSGEEEESEEDDEESEEGGCLDDKASSEDELSLASKGSVESGGAGETTQPVDEEAIKRNIAAYREVGFYRHALDLLHSFRSLQIIRYMVETIGLQSALTKTYGVCHR